MHSSLSEKNRAEGPNENVLDRLVEECDEGDDQADACDRPPVS